jgi:hypothetical protein
MTRLAQQENSTNNSGAVTKKKSFPGMRSCEHIDRSVYPLKKSQFQSS